ncbi:DHH family phosphoesterase [Candidatus Phytoplasma pruni]|uniref:Bifunctional oligoribonuclease/PAP phosphatase NrnA n=1 Tax=Candidatus Phytoplasma pruni TaxID=479893 RepID=A0A851HC14_9MOLU|nr:bifunctional oligoribonuclease/PAP phosphatase NrnA [Candidatus Phytoplasma pruni]NWN45615.1 bifunctional oligoribonuclease/PAP phosphatase NrnA [Candidatus Phytoplasma pruni]
MDFIKQQIINFDTIIIHGHKRPDGDCYGAQLGLKDIIQENYPDKKVYVVGEVNPKMAFLGDMDVITDETYQGALSIVVDCGNANIISDQRYKLGKMVIRIDHHLLVEEYGDYQWVEPQFASCSEMIYAFKEYHNYKISLKGAMPMYVGMVTDTGNFRFDRVTDKTLQMASELLQFEFNAFEIDKKINMQSLQMLKLKGYICENFIAEDGLIYIQISQEIIKKFNFSINEIFSIVNIYSNVTDYPVWAFIVEMPGKEWKLSIRSTGPKISHIVSKFGGGGHLRACGAFVKSQDDIDEIIKSLKQSIKEFKQEETVNISTEN